MNILPKILLLVNIAHTISATANQEFISSGFISSNIKRNVPSKVSEASNKVSKLRLILLGDLKQNEIVSWSFLERPTNLQQQFSRFSFLNNQNWFAIQLPMTMTFYFHVTRASEWVRQLLRIAGTKFDTHTRQAGSSVVWKRIDQSIDRQSRKIVKPNYSDTNRQSIY